MSTRYLEHKLPIKDRLRNFIAVDNLTAQVPLIELVQSRRKRHVRLWVAYNVERTAGTYIEVHTSGAVYTKTVYPSGKIEEKQNRKADHGNAHR